MKPAQASIKTMIKWPSDLAALHRLNPSRYPFLLESAAIGNSLGRYDLLFAFPQNTLRLDADFSLSGHTAGTSETFLESFDCWWSQESVPTMADSEQPFSGGWFLLLGYELARQIEPTLDLQTKPDQPVAAAIRVPLAVIRDQHEKQAWIIAEAGSEAMVQHILQDLEKLPDTRAPDNCHVISTAGQVVEDDPQAFIEAVKLAQRYIVAGDIFQANLSRQWTGTLRPGVQPIDIYARLRKTNPAPFAGLAVLDDFAVISSSPERLLRIRGNRVETRPIAGTRPRSPSRSGDALLRQELLANAKERAEHVMVIDLERNDLGRICNAGSIKIDEFMVIESYPHVHHIVSNISGELDDGFSPGAIIAALFPGGSITGCPKVRCMEIINELEDRPRGMYTGAMGYINRDGSGDLSILIRCITTAANELSLATGCGIVTDSVPAAELAETHAKAKGLILALNEC